MELAQLGQSRTAADELHAGEVGSLREEVRAAAAEAQSKQSRLLRDHELAVGELTREHAVCNASAEATPLARDALPRITSVLTTLAAQERDGELAAAQAQVEEARWAAVAASEVWIDTLIIRVSKSTDNDTCPRLMTRVYKAIACPLPMSTENTANTTGGRGAAAGARGVA